MVRKMKTSDFFEGNIRTFDAKHPYFQSKKSVVLQLPDRRLSPPKIFDLWVILRGGIGLNPL